MSVVAAQQQKISSIQSISWKLSYDTELVELECLITGSVIGVLAER
jgi:hypothetical protein